jgi:excinuclease ABC subunit C
LTAIPGIGEKRKMQLLRNFGSIVKIANASVDELKTIVGEKAAKEIFGHFERQRKLAER